MTHNFESFVPEQIFTMTLLHGIVLISWIVAIAANSNTGIPSDYNNPTTSMAQDEQSFMRHLAAGDTQGGYQTMFGGDAMNRYHDIYATAWRYIGFYIDCSNLYSNNNNNNHERDLGEDNQEERDLGENQGCNRYLLWAAVRLVVVNWVCFYFTTEFDTLINSGSSLSLFYVHLLYSMLTWAIPEGALENINTTIDSLANGPTCLATTPPAPTDVPRWIVICPLTISN